MNEVAQAAVQQPPPLSRLIHDILVAHEGERMSLRHLSAHLDDRAWGGLLIVFAAINLLPLPPGTTAITGIPLVLLTAQMAAGRARPWFPRRLDERGISTDHLRSIAGKIEPWEGRIERVLKPRLCELTNHRAARLIGIVALILSIVLWLPIPLGNHAPAFAITLFALALIYRDGVMVILGVLATIASLALLSVTIGATWWAIVQLWHHLT